MNFLSKKPSPFIITLSMCIQKALTSIDLLRFTTQYQLFSNRLLNPPKTDHHTRRGHNAESVGLKICTIAVLDPDHLPVVSMCSSRPRLLAPCLSKGASVRGQRISHMLFICQENGKRDGKSPLGRRRKAPAGNGSMRPVSGSATNTRTRASGQPKTTDSTPCGPNSPNLPTRARILSYRCAPI
jgi:hypothetical protein